MYLTNIWRFELITVKYSSYDVFICIFMIFIWILKFCLPRNRNQTFDACFFKKIWNFNFWDIASGFWNHMLMKNILNLKFELTSSACGCFYFKNYLNLIQSINLIRVSSKLLSLKKIDLIIQPLLLRLCSFWKIFNYY